MTEETEATRASVAGPAYAWQLPAWFPRAALVLGVICGISGAIAGITKIAHRVVVDCPNGTYFRAGETDFTCHSSPQLGTGVAITAGAIIGALLVILTAYIANELARAAGQRDVSSPD